MQKGVFPLKIKIRQICRSKFVLNQNLFIFHSVRIHFHYFWSSTLCWRYDVDTPKFGIVTWGSKFGDRNLGIETLQNPFERLGRKNRKLPKFCIIGTKTEKNSPYLFITRDDGQGHFQVIDRLAWNYYVHIMSLFSWKPYRYVYSYCY